MTKTKFIMINNQLITEENEFQLNSEELYIYSILEMSKDLNEEFYFSLSVLCEKTKILMGSSKQRAIKKIKEILFSLVKKNIITITNSNGEIVEDMKPNDVIVVHFSKIENKGFTQINLEMFNLIKSVEILYIYTATHRWAKSGDGSFTCSFDRWAKILQCSKRHAIDLINEATEKRIIYKNIGDYDNKGKTKKQEINKYKTTRFSKEEKTIHTKKADEDKLKKFIEKQETKISPLAEIELSTDLEHFDVDDLENSYYRLSNMTDENGRNVFPELDDYVILIDLKREKESRSLTELEIEVYNAGAKRMKILEKNKVSKEIMEKMFAKAYERIESRNLRNSEVTLESINSVEDMFGED